MGGDRGASVVEYLLLVAAVGVVVFALATGFSPQFGDEAPAALGGDEATSTTAVTVLGETLVQGGGGDVAVWVPPEAAGAQPFLLAARPEGLTLLDAGQRLLDLVPLEAAAGVDIRPEAGPGSSSGAVVVVGDGTSIRPYRLDARSSRLTPLAEPLPAGLRVAGLCLYRSPGSGHLSVFPFSREGKVVQWRLTGDSARSLTARRIRSFDVGAGVAACAADDAHGALYVSAPDAGLWRFPVEPPAPEGTLVDRVGAGGGLVAGVDALAVIDAAGGPGWILASSESDEAFSFYRRDSANDPAGRFPGSARVDRCQDTTGIDAAGGFLVCQAAQETQLLPLEDVTRLVSP